MGPMKLHRLLTAHVGVLNALAVALYNEEISADEATAHAQQHLEETLAAIKADK